MMDAALTTNIWVSKGTQYRFAEEALPEPPRKTAVCFSGGGTRAMSAAMGQLRGLRALNLIDKIGYISCVSGGSWASTIYTYYQTGAANDDELLGPIITPKETSMAQLKQLPTTRLGYPATLSLRDKLLELHEAGTPDDLLWQEGIGRIYFAPFGIDDSEGLRFFSLDETTVADILQRNPQLDRGQFVTVREADGKRPFLIINGSLIGPKALAPLEHDQLTGFDMTPLYTGIPFGQTITYHPLLKDAETRPIGSGYVESFAFGSSAPDSLLDDCEGTDLPTKCTVKVPGVKRPFTLTLASGISSAAFASILDKITSVIDPDMLYWPIQSPAQPQAESFNFGDGGDIENYGLLSLLLRKVNRVVIFVNSETKLNLDYDPSQPPEKGDIDTFLPPLFGFPTSMFPNNTVFTQDALVQVVHALQEKKRQGEPLVTVQTHTVQQNDWWGIEGGWEATVCWVYNDRVKSWEEQLPEEIQRDIDRGNESLIDFGPFKHFPNYKTMLENGLDLVELTPEQVNLLADLSCWNMLQSQDLLESLFAD
ncbi:MAG: hypothetical protein AAF614_18540 [Chloroflexota bacterium]